MKRKITEICEYLCCRKISADEHLLLSGLLDSFKLMELICSLEDEFQITFFPEEISEIDHFSCVDNIYKIVSDKKGEA